MAGGIVDKYGGDVVSVGGLVPGGLLVVTVGGVADQEHGGGGGGQDSQEQANGNPCLCEISATAQGVAPPSP
jgi:hypothetical protein